jgi:hypothetical protein
LEQFARSAVAQDPHVIDAVRAGGHPCDQGRDLQPGIRAVILRQLHVLVDQVAEAGVGGQAHDRDQRGDRHEIRIIERAGNRRPGMENLHLRDALLNHGKLL